MFVRRSERSQHDSEAWDPQYHLPRTGSGPVCHSRFNLKSHGLDHPAGVIGGSTIRGEIAVDKDGIGGIQGQALVVLLPVKSVGVMGDGRTYENVIALRCVDSLDAMTADWSKLPYELIGRISNRIINEVRGVNRVVFDVSSKPPSTIEWE